MNTLARYDTLSTSNVQQFEETLINWCKDNSKKGILVFDESSLANISKALKHSQYLNGLVFVKSSTRTKQMDTENLKIEWSSIDGEKSVLLSVAFKETGEILYESSHEWKDCKLFYGF